MTIIKFSKEKVYPATVSGKEIWEQKEPSQEMVWEICPYTRSPTLDGCNHCPQSETDTDYGKVQRGCYGMAAEACRIVFAMQNKNKKEP